MEVKMKKFFVLAAVLAAIFLVISCSDESENIPDSGNSDDNSYHKNELEGGIYLGIIGFNNETYSKDIDLLSSLNLSSYESFINNLHTQALTSLYDADYEALEMMKSYLDENRPSDLEKLALITFTDGEDNGSDKTLETVHNMIATPIHGLSVEAYTIGLTSQSMGDLSSFQKALEQLASNPDNKYEADDMNKVKEHFRNLADSLSSTSKTANLVLKVPKGQTYINTRIYFTFDNPKNCKDSKLYISATVRESNNGRTLEDISYYGFKPGEPTMSSNNEVKGYYYFNFENITYSDGSIPEWTPEIITEILQLWKAPIDDPSSCNSDIEFHPEDGSQMVIHQASALIMLVLDCTESLGKNFGEMQNAAKEFVRTLLNKNGSGGNNDGGNNSSSESENESGNEECATNTAGQSCTSDEECGNCMICVSAKCAKGCTSDSDCQMSVGLKCNKNLARCVNVVASNKACSESNCPSGCCYAEKGLSGIKCSSSANVSTCGLCSQGEIYSPSDSKCLPAACSTTTDNCSSINQGASNPPAKCYSCKAGDFTCQKNTTTSGCSAGMIINMNQCIPSGQQCVEGLSECCSGMPCIEGFCY